MTYTIDISPDVLAAGHWVPGRHGILRWVPDHERVGVVACDKCQALTTEPCRKPTTGKVVKPHTARAIPQTCACGAPRERRQTYCEDCRIESRRATGRQVWARRRRALLDELGDVEGIA